VVSFTIRPLCTEGESPCYPLDRTLVGPQSQSRNGGKDKNSKSLVGPKHTVIQSVAQRYTIDLSWILC